MGYQMEYGSWDKPVKYRRTRDKKMRYITIFLVLALIICCFQSDRIINFLLPGDVDATRKAITVFVNELKEGEPLFDAFGSFCKVVLNEAEIY